MTKPRPLKYLSALSEEKQYEIFCMLENSTYKKVQEYLEQPAPTGVGAKVSISTLQRFYARCSNQDLTERRSELTDNAKAWLKWASQGDPTAFDAAALERIKMRTFELASTLKDSDELAELKTLFAIIFAARLVEVRKRGMAVQERLAALRELEALARVGTRTTHSTRSVEPTESPNMQENTKPGSAPEILHESLKPLSFHALEPRPAEHEFQLQAVC